MTIERRNPLPINRYWIDIFESGFSTFETWLANNATTVYVETTEDYSQDDPPARFYVFRVTAPTSWPDNRGLGLPTIATANVHSRADTATRPPPQVDPITAAAEGASDAAKAIAKAVTFAGAVAVAGLLVAVAVKLAKRRSQR